MIEKKNRRYDIHNALFNSSKTYIHPTSFVDSSVKVGTGVKIGPHSVIMGDTFIGDQTIIYGYASIGYPAQDIGTHQSLGKILIGNDCHIREYSSISSPKSNSSATIIGNNCYIMNYAHVSHDSILGNNVTLVNHSSLGGHTQLADNVIVMAYAATHQFTKIGPFSALAPYSGTRQDIPPFCLYNGKPALFSRINTIALQRSNTDKESIASLKKLVRYFFYDKYPLNVIIEKIKEDDISKDPLIETFITFVQSSNRGISRQVDFKK